LLWFISNDFIALFLPVYINWSTVLSCRCTCDFAHSCIMTVCLSLHRGRSGSASQITGMLRGARCSSRLSRCRLRISFLLTSVTW